MQDKAINKSSPLTLKTAAKFVETAKKNSYKLSLKKFPKDYAKADASAATAALKTAKRLQSKGGVDFKNQYLENLVQDQARKTSYQELVKDKPKKKIGVLEVAGGVIAGALMVALLGVVALAALTCCFVPFLDFPIFPVGSGRGSQEFYESEKIGNDAKKEFQNSLKNGKSKSEAMQVALDHTAPPAKAPGAGIKQESGASKTRDMPISLSTEKVNTKSPSIEKAAKEKAKGADDIKTDTTKSTNLPGVQQSLGNDKSMKR